jgi:homoserine O-acetyltransferase/O-succinyltransferase
MPLASLPTQIAGRNRMSRKMIMDSIREDPAYNNGDYESQPVYGLKSALYILTWMSSIPLLWQTECPDRDAADAFLDRRIATALETADANDMWYQVNASFDYDPRPLLDHIKAPLFAINTADDQVNPPELRILEDGIRRVKNGRALVLEISEATRGHGSHTFAKLWLEHLRSLLQETEA